jgi:hypothetical protein
MVWRSRGKSIGMARHTVCRKSLKLADRRSLVTIVANQRGVCAYEGESVLVILDILK